MPAGAKLNMKAGAKIRGGGHSRERSLGKLKELTAITLAAAQEPTSWKKIKIKGRQHLSEKNKDHVGVAETVLQCSHCAGLHCLKCDQYIATNRSHY